MVVRASEMSALCPTYPTVPHCFLRAHRAETNLWSNLRRQQVSVERTEDRGGKQSHFVGVGHAKMLRCGMPRTMVVLPDTDCEAREEIRAHNQHRRVHLSGGCAPRRRVPASGANR